MTDKIAVDIALLPPAEIMDELIAINKKLLNKASSEIKLNKENCLPHITLMQAIFDKNDLSEIKKILSEIGRELKPIRVNGQMEPFNDKIFCLRINPTHEIQKLHEQIMHKLSGIASNDAKAEHFNGNNVSDSTIDYVRDFKDSYAFGNYDPHITLGHGNLETNGHELSFSASRLAACYLGANNTCSNILFETSCG